MNVEYPKTIYFRLLLLSTKSWKLKSNNKKGNKGRNRVISLTATVNGELILGLTAKARICGFFQNGVCKAESLLERDNQTHFKMEKPKWTLSNVRLWIPNAEPNRRLV